LKVPVGGTEFGPHGPSLERHVAHVPRVTGMRIPHLLLVVALLLPSISNGQEKNAAYLLDLRGPIGPATSDYVHRGMEKVPTAVERDVVRRRFLLRVAGHSGRWPRPERVTWFRKPL
jgi:hypothetical protein